MAETRATAADRARVMGGLSRIQARQKGGRSDCALRPSSMLAGQEDKISRDARLAGHQEILNHAAADAIAAR
ncbi:hypothetical protein AQ619_02195 [Caulobacter henricii]|uniref:Uncharacterized protein n=1 Tax=Caulobacter henricii TaxID=69395 RepID=A0A0P0NWP0_9CAUL|nr:hypothetical protein AQ619_02195 [Caulobacter henricii]